MIFRTKNCILSDRHHCFCENLSGGIKENGIVCGRDSDIDKMTAFKVDNCAEDEWCFESENSNERVSPNNRKDLCVKGFEVLPSLNTLK